MHACAVFCLCRGLCLLQPWLPLLSLFIYLPQVFEAHLPFFLFSKQWLPTPNAVIMCFFILGAVSSELGCKCTPGMGCASDFHLQGVSLICRSHAGSGEVARDIADNVTRYPRRSPYARFVLMCMHEGAPPPSPPLFPLPPPTASQRALAGRFDSFSSRMRINGRDEVSLFHLISGKSGGQRATKAESPPRDDIFCIFF